MDIQTRLILVQCMYVNLIIRQKKGHYVTVFKIPDKTTKQEECMLRKLLNKGFQITKTSRALLCTIFLLTTFEASPSTV